MDDPICACNLMSFNATSLPLQGGQVHHQTYLCWCELDARNFRKICTCKFNTNIVHVLCLCSRSLWETSHGPSQIGVSIIITPSWNTAVQTYWKYMPSSKFSISKSLWLVALARQVVPKAPAPKFSSSWKPFTSSPAFALHTVFGP